MKAQFRWQNFVKDNAADTGFDSLSASLLVSDLNLGSEVDSAQFIGELGVFKTAEKHAFSFGSTPDGGQVVATENHVQGWGYGWLTAAWQQQIVITERQVSSLLYGGFRQRNVDCHLVAIKVSIESRTYQRVDLDGTAVNEHRLKGLDAESVQGGRPVKQDRSLSNDFLQYVKYFRFGSLHQPPGALDVGGKTLRH